jgi:hypothetical protein
MRFCSDEAVQKHHWVAREGASQGPDIPLSFLCGLGGWDCGSFVSVAD